MMMMMKLSLVTVVLAQDNPFANLQASSKLENAVKSAEDKDAAVRGIAQPEVEPEIAPEPEIEPEVIIEPEDGADGAEIVSEPVEGSSDGLTSCGSHTAASCEDCLVKAEADDTIINKSGFCNGDCVFDHDTKTCQASEVRVDCGHHQAASCAKCTNDEEGERFCHDDCEWANDECSPKA